MKYLKEFITDKFKIQPLGELTTKEIFSADYELIGLSLVIDGYEIGIQAWYVDYAKWLEEKYERTSKLLDAWLTTDNGVVSLTT